jgi:hypothetical protein
MRLNFVRLQTAGAQPLDFVVMQDRRSASAGDQVDYPNRLQH